MTINIYKIYKNIYKYIKTHDNIFKKVTNY